MKLILSSVVMLFSAIILLACDNVKASEANFFGVFGNDKTSMVDAYKIGDVVDDFSLKNVDGSMVSMSKFGSAKGFIIVFTCNTCPYSKMYEDRIIALNSKYASKGWPVIAINPNDPSVQDGDSFEEMQVRAKEKNFSFPYLFDEGQKVYPKWGAARTPHVFIVSKKAGGNVLEYIGAIDDNARDASQVTVNYVDETISALTAGTEPTERTTKAIGCAIKTK